MSASPPPPLWNRRDAVGSLSVGGVGAVLCAVAWWMASGDRTFREQLSLATVSIVGVVLIVAAETAWVLRGRANVGRRIRALLGAAPVATVDEPVVADDGALVAGQGLRRYHRPDCALARGHDWPATGWDEHRRAGRQPCGICRPHGVMEEAV